MPKKSKKNREVARPASGERMYSVTLNRRFQGQQPHSSFPDRVEQMLDYWSVNRVNPGVVTYQDTVFNVNSLFDPEFTGTGHQPREFDTWASIYAKYRVLECLVEVDVRQRASHGITVCVVPSNSSTALTIGDYPQELPRAVRLGITGSSQPPVRASIKIDPRAILGMTPAEFRGDDSTGALVTASPSQLVYLHVFAAQLDGTTVCDFEFTLRMRFRCEFYDRKTLAPSALVAAVAARIGALQEMVAQSRSDVSSDGAAIVQARPPPELPRTSLAEALASAFLGAPRPSNQSGGK
jgi:hypothetical protein